jgi:hypothetical protein
MTQQQLELTARALVAEGKGILAVDEKRFQVAQLIRLLAELNAREKRFQ